MTESPIAGQSSTPQTAGMRLPYGLSDYQRLIGSGSYYADRTHLIPAIEAAGEQLLLLRPRRFGKSLLLSMLENYYDLNRADRFSELFGPLAIGQHPTPRHNRYLILKWNFSTIDAGGDIESIARGVHGHINSMIRDFSVRYRDRLEQEIVIDDDSLRSLEHLLVEARRIDRSLYLLVDEYDNFANEVLTHRNQGQARYEALVRGEGILKTVFKVVKAATEGGGLERVFITGVSPLVMSDITSGYNVAINISLEQPFDALCGFREDEVLAMNRRIAAGCRWPADRAEEAMTLMRRYYNGYRFSANVAERLYNPTLCLYFWRTWQNEGAYPKQLLDDNLAMDKNRIAYIAALPHGNDVIERLSAGERIATNHLQTGFGIEALLQRQVPDEGYLLSLLYWFGVLTLNEIHALGESELMIPNQVIRQLYLERLQRALLPGYTLANQREQVAKVFYLSGDLAPLVAFIETNMLQGLANRDLAWANELSLKLILLTLLHNTFWYTTRSEQAAGKRYIDLLLEVRPDLRHTPLLDHLFELKFIPLNQLKLSDRELQALSPQPLAELPLVARALDGADAQGEAYCQQLQREEPAIPWRLHRHSVVLLGFSRLVWRSVASGGNSDT